MSLIEFANVDLDYPLRENVGLSLKDYILRDVLGRKKDVRRTVRALNNLSFRINQGERVGIIGHNGAGKSTVLRTIAGVYPIVGGRRTVDGSVCSLFDIALGFEMHASGWKNIRYRAYLQGETPASLKDKVADIAAFTELGDFLDLPLRTYSSGMLMRLAFAIATSSDPEILLIDEVFNTGDMRFQLKAEQRLGAMMDRAQIVVMVGHDLQAILKFCDRVIWMDHGRIHADGRANPTIGAYCNYVRAQAAAAAAA